ncbi:MAG: hypothetical protein ACUVRZ_03600 [Desulfobacca sp.]|uniref:hypothetical protein n=1 Tax=Desulfobacca sp. TaxID=2067990 RepID=UPI00404AF12E
MRATWEKGLLRGILLLWLLQLSWLTWHFTPEALELRRRLWSGPAEAASQPADPFAAWLADLTRLLPADSTYILLDCYETGNYARMRYTLYPRRQLRLDPKTSPSLLFTTIQKEGATFVIVGGCQRIPRWQGLFQEQQAVFQPLPTTGPGMIVRVAPDRIIGGFYD